MANQLTSEPLDAGRDAGVILNEGLLDGVEHSRATYHELPVFLKCYLLSPTQKEPLQ
jgi:hypothetical protein